MPSSLSAGDLHRNRNREGRQVRRTRTWPLERGSFASGLLIDGQRRRNGRRGRAADGMAPATGADPRHLARLRGDVLDGLERDDDVEARVAVGQVLGIGLLKLDRQSLGGGALMPRVKG